MEKILKNIFGIFGWVFFLYDVKSLFLAFIIHLAIIFFLVLIVFYNFGIIGTIIAFAFIYLGGANILMIQQLSKSNQQREEIANILKEEKND